MPGPSMKIGTLQELMLESVGQRGSKDLKDLWFEYIYGTIRETPWAWNFKTTSVVSWALYTSVDTFTWTSGNDYLQAGGALTIPFSNTGRYVIIDDIPYKVVRLDTVLNRVILEGRVHTTVTVAETITLYRADVGLKTSSIKDVSFNKCKVISANNDNTTKFNFMHRNYLPRDSGEAILYECDDSNIIAPPKYPPSVNSTANPGNIEAGEYRYFFTFYDSESGLESAPGPELVFSDVLTFQNTYAYDNPEDPNRSEGPTYMMRLWRSKKDVGTDRYPAYLVGTKAPMVNGDFVADNVADKIRKTKEKYYDGHRTTITFRPFPDDKYPINVLHVNDWERRPDPEDFVDVGRNNGVIELLNIGASIFVEQGSRSLETMFAAQVKFKQQLAYLLRKSGDSNDADHGVENYTPNDGRVNSDRYNDPINSWTWKQ